MPFQDRSEAGKRLADEVASRIGPPKPGERRLVLALPRGGVPVAAEVAKMLDAPLDVLNVRKLGVPGHEELAMGAIAVGGHRILDRDLIARIGITEDQIDATQRREHVTLTQREDLYRGGLGPLDVEGATVVLVDDGVATGSTMKVALEVLSEMHAAKVIAAIPLAPMDTLPELEVRADDVVCLEMPSPFLAVGQEYASFPSVSDETVVRLLVSSRQRTPQDA